MATSLKISIPFKPDYKLMWDTVVVRPERLNEVNEIISKITLNRKRYENIANIIKVPYPHSSIPWYFIAVIHKMEANLDFNRHLHNGDPLLDRTVHEVKGRPIKGNPPFSWEQSAFDALCNVSGLHKVTDWSIPALLYLIEGYNGYGYSKYHSINSPYLWAGTNFYIKGKYVADGKFDPNAVSSQIGVVPILKQII